MIAIKLPPLMRGFAAFLAASVLLNAESANSAKKSAESKDETVELSPFVVDTTKDAGYASKNTVAGTGFDTTLMKTPQTIGIMNQEMMQDLAAYNMIDSLQFTTAGISRNGWNNGDDVYSWGFRQSNAIKDGVPLLGQGANTLYDVDRVEVIKGPAAMLYGQAAAFGGIINYVTRQATRTPHVSVTGRVGSHKLGGLEAHFSGPINDRLRYRVDLGAQSKREARKYSFARDQFIGGGFEYDISEYAKIVTNASWFSSKYNKAYTIIDPRVALEVPAGVNPLFYAVEAKIMQGVPDDYTVNQPWNQYSNLRYSADATLTMQLGEKLSSKTFVGWQGSQLRWIRDQAFNWRETVGGTPVSSVSLTDGTFAQAAVVFQTNDHNLNIVQTFLKELNTGFLHHKIIGGGDQRDVVTRQAAWNHMGVEQSYLNPFVWDFRANDFTFNTDPTGPLPSNAFNYNAYNGSSKSYARNSGVFLQDAVSFWDDKITVLGGWRWVDRFDSGGLAFDTQSSNGVGDLKLVTNPGATTPVIGANNVQTVSVSNTSVYRYGVLYAPTDNYSIYYNHAEALQFQGGVDYLNRPLDPSFSISKEVGAKGQFFNGALGVSLTHFDLTVTNVRLTFIEGPNDPVPGTISIIASGFQTNQGWDFSINGNKNFDLGTLNMIATAYKGHIQTELGIRPSRIADTTESIFGSFQITKGSFKGLKVGGGTNWSGDRVGPSLSNGVNNGAQTRIKPYSTTNLLASYGWGRWKVQGNIDNVFNKIFIDGLESAFWVVTNPGRTYRLSVTYSY